MEGQGECPNDQHRADTARHLVHTEGGHKTQGFAEEKQETRGQHKAGYGGAQGGQHHENRSISLFWRSAHTEPNRIPANTTTREA
mgnify:CR=1 FL=1